MIDRGRNFFNFSFKAEATTSTDALHPTNICSISSGTDCPYFVSTIEWSSQTGFPEALLVTPAHATSEGGDDDDGNEDEGDEDDSSDYLGGSSPAHPFLPVEHAATRPWRSGGLHEKKGAIGARQRDIIERYAMRCHSLSRVPD